MLSLSSLRSALQSAASEPAEVNAITRALAAAGVRRPPRVLTFRQGRQVLRAYLWAETPLGAVALVAGPSMRGTVYVVEHAAGEVDAEDVEVVIPDGANGWVAWKASARGNERNRGLTRGMVGRATYPRQNPLSRDFAAQLAALRERPASVCETDEDEDEGVRGGGARAPLFGPLYDAAGRKYRVLYRVIATRTDGRGPVLASNLPGSYDDTPGYPIAFQARSLKRAGERMKIERIAAELDPDRLVLPHADPTFGAPVVWEGNGQQGTKPGTFYVLGGNSRTLAFLAAPPSRIREYDERVRELWPDAWPDEPAPSGYRYLLVRQVYPADCPSMADALALNAACQMGLRDAQALAGATQQSMAGRETPLGEALSLVRGLGLSENLAAEIPAFAWTGVVARDNVDDFARVPGNQSFLDLIRNRIGAERFDSYMGDPDNAAKLVNSVLIGFLPRDILDRGFGNEREEKALLAALPIMATIAIAEKARDIPRGWDLLSHLSDARLFADTTRALSVKAALDKIESMYRQESLDLRTREGDPVRSLAARIGPLGVLLALTFKRAEAQRDPTVGIDTVLGPYLTAAMQSGVDYPTRQAGLFGGGSAATMPVDLPVVTLGTVLAQALRGPTAAPIVPQTRSTLEAPAAEPEPEAAPAPSMFGRPAPAPAPVVTATVPAPVAAPAAPWTLPSAIRNALLMRSDLPRVAGYEGILRENTPAVRAALKASFDALNREIRAAEQAAQGDGLTFDEPNGPGNLMEDQDRKVFDAAVAASTALVTRLEAAETLRTAWEAGIVPLLEAVAEEVERTYAPDNADLTPANRANVLATLEEKILTTGKTARRRLREARERADRTDGAGVAAPPGATPQGITDWETATDTRLRVLDEEARIRFARALAPVALAAPVAAPAPSSDDLAAELLRQAGLSPEAPAARTLPAPPPDEDPLPPLIFDGYSPTGDVYQSWLELYREARAFDRDALRLSPANHRWAMGQVKDVRRWFYQARNDGAGRFSPAVVREGAARIRNVRDLMLDLSSGDPQDQGARPTPLYVPYPPQPSDPADGGGGGGGGGGGTAARPSAAAPVGPSELRLNARGAALARATLRSRGGIFTEAEARTGWWWPLWPELTNVALATLSRPWVRLSGDHVSFGSALQAGDLGGSGRATQITAAPPYLSFTLGSRGAVEISAQREVGDEIQRSVRQALLRTGYFTDDAAQGWTVQEALADATLPALDWDVRPLLQAMNIWFGEWSLRDQFVLLSEWMVRSGTPEVPEFVRLPDVARDGAAIYGAPNVRPELVPLDYFAQAGSWRTNGALLNLYAFLTPAGMRSTVPSVYGVGPFTYEGIKWSDVGPDPKIVVDTLVRLFYPTRKVKVKVEGWSARKDNPGAKVRIENLGEEYGRAQRDRQADHLPAVLSAAYLALTAGGYGSGEAVYLDNVRIPPAAVYALGSAVEAGRVSASAPDFEQGLRQFGEITDFADSPVGFVKDARSARLQGLPVYLAAFRAMREDNGVELRWGYRYLTGAGWLNLTVASAGTTLLASLTFDLRKHPDRVQAVRAAFPALREWAAEAPRGLKLRLDREDADYLGLSPDGDPAGGDDKAARVAALLRGNPRGGYRRNGVALDATLRAALSRILREKYRRTEADTAAVLALMERALALLDGDGDTSALAAKILGKLDQILAIHDESAPAPVPAHRRVKLYQPTTSKQGRIEEYAASDLTWRPIEGGVEKVLNLTNAEWDKLAQNLLAVQTQLGAGGTDTTVPGPWPSGNIMEWPSAERERWKAGAYSLFTEINAPNRPTFYTDRQGYDYARYVAFPADLPADKVRARFTTRALQALRAPAVAAPSPTRAPVPAPAPAPVPAPVPDPVKYRYGAGRRPAGYASVPSGFIGVDPSVPDYPDATRFGVVVYHRPLSDKEIRSFDLARYFRADQLVDDLYANLRTELKDGEEERELAAEMQKDPKFARQGVGRLAENLGPFFSDVPFEQIAERVAARFIEDVLGASAARAADGHAATWPMAGTADAAVARLALIERVNRPQDLTPARITEALDSIGQTAGKATDALRTYINTLEIQGKLPGKLGDRLRAALADEDEAEQTPARASMPTIEALQRTGAITIYPDATGRLQVQVFQGGSPTTAPVAPGKSRPDALEDLLRRAGKPGPFREVSPDYIAVNTGSGFVVMPTDEAAMYLTNREIEWSQRSREEHNRAADETRALQALGAEKVPGIRLADAEAAGRVWRAVEAGSMTRAAWEEYVAQLRREGRVSTPAAPADGERERAEALFRAAGLTDQKGGAGAFALTVQPDQETIHTLKVRPIRRYTDDPYQWLVVKHTRFTTGTTAAPDIDLGTFPTPEAALRALEAERTRIAAPAARPSTPTLDRGTLDEIKAGMAEILRGMK